MRRHHDKETGIETTYLHELDGIKVELDDSWRPGATISLFQRSRRASGGRQLLYTTVDCPKELFWTPAEPKTDLLHTTVGFPKELPWTPAIPESFNYGFEIGYWADGCMRYEMLATKEEAVEIASQAEYDEQDVAYIKVPHTFSIGKSTVWLQVERQQLYSIPLDVNIRLCVEFANREEFTQFIEGGVEELESREINGDDSDVGVMHDIMRALFPIYDDFDTAERNAVRRRIPPSQFGDEYPQPETQVIQRRGSNRGDDRPCFLTLHLYTWGAYRIHRVHWSATDSPSTFPSPSGAFRSLNNVHLKFPSPASQDRNHGSSSQSHPDDLTISISASEISFSTGTCSISPGQGSTLSSEHCTVNINNYINKIMGDAFFGTINGGNNGGRNNANTIRISSPVGSRSPRILCPLPRRPTPPLQRQMESQGGVGRWVQPRPSRPRPY